MAKKKKIDFGFTPSEYQEKIFDFIQNGHGNAVVEALAGSAKTTTAVSAMKLIPKSEKCLFIAFNKSIVAELNEKLSTATNVTVRTSHSLGYLMCTRNIEGDIQVNEYKYRVYLKNNIDSLSKVARTKLTRVQKANYIDNITDLINFSRLNLCQCEREVKAIADKYDIPLVGDEVDVVLKCMLWGKKNTETIDYTDMLWLPTELDMNPVGLKYDWIFCDECQDFSLAMVKLFFKCFKRGTRFMAVGDKKQSINLFAGASSEAFDMMKEQPNTEIFELPITYRCCNKVVELARQFVPNILAKDGAIEGEVIEESHVKDIKDGDMVLCRSKAPLVKLYTMLLKRGVKCYIKGNDIRKTLKDTVDKYDVEKVNKDLQDDGLFVRLYATLFEERNKLMTNRGLDYTDATLSEYVMNQYDTINTLYVLSEGCKTKKELLKNINKIFTDEEEGVCLSTVHKAKGLEADNVYILCRSSMPSKLADKDWEKEQEENLIYVAYTRAKKRLGFVSEKEVKPSGSSMKPDAILAELRAVEVIVCKILGKEPMTIQNTPETAKKNIENITTELPKKPRRKNNVKMLSRKELTLLEDFG